MGGPLPLGVPWGFLRTLLSALGAFRAPWALFGDGFRTSSGAKGPLRGPPCGAWTFLGLYGGLQGSLTAPLPSRMCPNTIKTNGFLHVSIVFPGHARRSLRCCWGLPWDLRSVPRLSPADSGASESSLGRSLGVLRGLLGEPSSVPCA